MKPSSDQSNTNGQMGTPGLFGYSRGRLLSFNTPKLSPMKMVQSPCLNLSQGSILDHHFGLNNEFKLEEDPHGEDNVDVVRESSEDDISEFSYPEFPEDEEVTKDNLIAFLVDTININEDRIQKVKEKIESSGQKFFAEVFQYLYKRFKKTKKTKEEMIKYTMRKSFKYITDQMKKDDPSLVSLLNTDGIEGMNIYFGRYCDSEEVSIPFKKNSMEKTMNTAFLKKIFTIHHFAKDYKRFLKHFPQEFLKDNNKKVKSMSDSLKVCLNTKNYKNLQNYKRIPWTKDILFKLRSFAQELLTYSSLQPPIDDAEDIKENSHQHKMDMDSHYDNDVKANCKKKSMDSPHIEFLDDGDNGRYEDDMYMSQLRRENYKKKSVIILTPPMLPMNSPKLEDDFPRIEEDLLE